MAANTPLHVPKIISKLLTEISMINDVSEKTSKVSHHVRLLEDEMSKIDDFKHELPHCMLFLNDACERLKKEMTQHRERDVPPVLIEFLPLKGNLDEDREAKMSNDCSDKNNVICQESDINTQDPKMDLRLDLRSKDKEDGGSSRSNEGSFVPFNRQSELGFTDENSDINAQTSCVLALEATQNYMSQNQPQKQQPKKQRR
ncbi:transcription factor HHO5-like [Cornus florida]|uniref:transcription factor HHO5-like n=1 Tax=Cornus florida TaxID=4283 RepID=UPI00289E1080|nr:transcription factor HHO5-like [Cornus florida]